MFGTCLGGPVGLLAGVKIGGLAAIGGSVFGKYYLIQSCCRGGAFEVSLELYCLLKRCLFFQVIQLAQ